MGLFLAGSARIFSFSNSIENRSLGLQALASKLNLLGGGFLLASARERAAKTELRGHAASLSNYIASLHDTAGDSDVR